MLRQFFQMLAVVAIIFTSATAHGQGPADPTLVATNSQVFVGQPLQVTLTGPTAFSPFIMAANIQAFSQPTPFGVLGLPDTTTAYFIDALDANGTFVATTGPVAAMTVGTTFFAQALVCDSSYPNGYRFTSDGAGSPTTNLTIVSGIGMQTLSGIATFEDPTYVDGVGYPGDAPNVEHTPIRFADVELVNATTMAVLSSGSATDGTGRFTFTYPTQVDPVFVRVMASTDNSASLYRIRVRLFTGGSNISVPLGTEPVWSRASQNFPGNITNMSADFEVPVNPGPSVTANFNSAAFNILETMQRVQDGVRAVAGLLPQLHAYSAPNGGTEEAFYGGQDQSGVAWELIGGGMAGQAETTDHHFFDDGLIAHEFGHFLEASIFKTSSFGGSHNLGARTIPNVAYSEGFATWIGGVALNNPLYGDGGGYGATTLPGFTINLESEPLHDIPNMGDGPHGIHDEVVASEILWDLNDGANGPADADSDGISVPVSQIFAVMANFNQNDFIHILDVLKGLDSANGGPIPTATLTNLTTFPEPTGFTYPPVGLDLFPTPLVVGGAAISGVADGSVSARSNGGYGGGPDWANLTEANRFFEFVATATSHTITLDHVSPNGGFAPNDLDFATLSPTDPFLGAEVSFGEGLDVQTINAFGLTIGQTYVVWVRAWVPTPNNFLFASSPLIGADSTSFNISVN